MQLTDIQKDALQEMGNIGAAHAATTLSTMLNTSIEMNIPEVYVIDLAHVHEYISDDPAALVLFQINGEVSPGGYLFLHVPVRSATRLVNMMLGYTEDTEREMTEMDRSALLEIGNIMVSAFLDGTAGLLNTVMIPSPPDLVIDMPHAALEGIIASQMAESNELVFFRTNLKSPEHSITSNILLLPNPPMLNDIIRMLEKVLAGG